MLLVAAGAMLEAGADSTVVGPATRNASPKHLETVQQERRALEKKHAARLDAFAQEFTDLGLKHEADTCHELAAPLSTALFRIQKPPKEKQRELPKSLPEKEHDLRVDFRDAQVKYAAELYRLSRKALSAGYPSYAYALVQEVVRQDSDHASARRILGYKLRNKEWLTPYAAERLEKGYVWDERFGWLRKQDVERYKAGQRLYLGRWMSADKESEIRRDFRHAWEARTDHYRVHTNLSLERGVEIAKSLEQFHDFFMQTFAAFFSTPDQMAKLFQTSGPNSNLMIRRDPYDVDYFRTRQEYVDRLKNQFPQIDMTNGLYYTRDRVAYFFFNPDQKEQDTLFHEATHQLFYENLRASRMVALEANFWIVEGIACYMESYHAENGQCSVGDPHHIRIQNARERVVLDNYYVPLERFVAMGMNAFQKSPDIRKNYSQAAGLAHFFMHYEGGRYRDALIEHLAEIYHTTGRQRAIVKSLDELTGVSFADLDRQYVEYMHSLPTGLGPLRAAAVAPPRAIEIPKGKGLSQAAAGH
ncbi:MAG TPA: DUF1570 domain-containing protein [Planctomycetaceae bacterium]|nr:DUF1570 domain-containing protein [Planctomycetaceae bacterium]